MTPTRGLGLNGLWQEFADLRHQCAVERIRQRFTPLIPLPRAFFALGGLARVRRMPPMREAGEPRPPFGWVHIRAWNMNLVWEVPWWLAPLAAVRVNGWEGYVLPWLMALGLWEMPHQGGDYYRDGRGTAPAWFRRLAYCVLNDRDRDPRWAYHDVRFHFPRVIAAAEAQGERITVGRLVEWGWDEREEEFLARRRASITRGYMLVKMSGPPFYATVDLS